MSSREHAIVLVILLFITLVERAMPDGEQTTWDTWNMWFMSCYCLYCKYSIMGGCAGCHSPYLTGEEAQSGHPFIERAWLLGVGLGSNISEPSYRRLFIAWLSHNWSLSEIKKKMKKYYGGGGGSNKNGRNSKEK